MGRSKSELETPMKSQNNESFLSSLMDTTPIVADKQLKVSGGAKLSKSEDKLNQNIAIKKSQQSLGLQESVQNLTNSGDREEGITSVNLCNKEGNAEEIGAGKTCSRLSNSKTTVNESKTIICDGFTVENVDNPSASKEEILTKAREFLATANKFGRKGGRKDGTAYQPHTCIFCSKVNEVQGPKLKGPKK